jgi:hypothetical protein
MAMVREFDPRLYIIPDIVLFWGDGIISANSNLIILSYE